MKLNVKSFAMSLGICFGLAVLLVTIWFLIMGYQGSTLGLLRKIYLGYSVSWPGAFIGLVWGFVDGLISGAIFAWLYNKLSPKPKTQTD
jgi:hypothetical protein